jgi:Domain of unknown function (DUF927)
MSLSLDFLGHVLPDEGWHAAFILDTKTHIWCRTVETLADRILDTEGSGQTVYHACASYKEKSRKAEHALAARSFWCDVDLTDKQGNVFYDSPQSAAQATYEFCNRVGLPIPTLVGSGAGLHLYWTLLQAVEPALWHRYGKALRNLCQSSGFHTDPVRTADIASILRTPGTTNRKRTEPVFVDVGPFEGPYRLEDFKELENYVDQQSTSGSSQGNTRNRLEEIPTTARGLANTFDAQPRYLQSISEHCGQIRNFRETLGRLPEPLWHACLGVAAFCEDGGRLGHDWSKGDSRYQESQTEEKLSRQGRFGPTTCAKFHSFEPKICEACPHFGKIKSPITLSERPQAITVQSPQAKTEGKEVQGLSGRVSGHQVSQALNGFGYAKDGKLVALSSTNMGPTETPVADFRLELISVHNEEIGQESNLSFTQVLPHEGKRAFSLSARNVFGHGVGAEFAAKGALIYDHQEFTRYIKGMIRLLRDAGRDTMQYEQFGWKNNETAFLYGLDLYTATGIERVSGNNELQIRCREDWIGPCKRGNLDTWKRAINALFVAGCEPQSVCLLAAFAAPLIRFTATDEGGAIIHLVTRESGKGKSTALIAAASVWGRKEGLGLTNEDTQVAKALTLGALGNLPVVHDELSLRDPEVIRKTVMEFSNGRGRMRGTRTGEIKHTASTWQTLMLSASNSSLVDILSLQDIEEAPAMRVLELVFSLPPELKREFGDKLVRTLRANSGYAGDAYLRWLVPNVKWVKDALEQIIDDLWKETQWPPACRFWIRTIACILVAGKIVQDLELVDFSIERIREWIMKNVQYEKDETSKSNWAVNALNRFISAHSAAHCIIMPGPFIAGNFSSKTRPEQMPKGDLIMRSEISSRKLYIAIPPLRAWLAEQNLSYREWISKLQVEQIITNPRCHLTLGAGADIPSGQEWCVAVDMTHEQMTGFSNVIQFPAPPVRSSSAEDDAPPQQPS